MRFVGIDPSTKTGFVVIDEQGQVLREKEITGIGAVDPKRMRTMIVDLMAHIQKGDVIAIEGYAFGAKGQGIKFQYGLGEGIRMALDARKMSYIEVAPNALKKYVGVTGWTGEAGSKKKLAGKEKKKAVMDAVYSHYGYKHRSDNVTDAFVIAQIAKDTWELVNEDSLLLNNRIMFDYQNEVLNTILKGAI